MFAMVKDSRTARVRSRTFFFDHTPNQSIVLVMVKRAVRVGVKAWRLIKGDQTIVLPLDIDYMYIGRQTSSSQTKG